ncbi:MAG: hypothetical protein LBJ00_12565 [Planctomycetaceae bacterium]|nr:hypothetical protein [Planctomycetaceae bacterium]
MSAEEVIAQLIGDGVADDTQAIQVMLDSGEKLVYLPPPAKHYVISKPLRIHSNQTLKLDAATVVRLADGSNNYMLVNAEPDQGNKNIVISGGIWNGNNVNIDHAKGKRNGTHPHNFFIGSVFLIMNTENLRIEKLTVKDPEKFGIHLGKCRKFTVDGITFDYNAREHNMDGVHLQGGCREGTVTNIKGNTYDDMIALNADDGEYWEVTQGAITDIRIDGVWATNCFRAVRFLSTGTPIKRISISNIFGSYFRNTIAFTHWRLDLKERPRFEDIAISNIFTAKITDKEFLENLGKEGERRRFAIIGIEGQLSFSNLTISNLFRTEWMPDAAPTIRIQQGTIIETLCLRNIQQINMTDNPLTFLHNDASILRLTVDGVVIREKDAEKSITTKGIGRVLNRNGDIVTYGEKELQEEINHADEELRTNPQKQLTL